jgi:hypothetical protein
MRRELEDKLKQEFPILFQNLNIGNNGFHYSIYVYGIEHGDGWYDIIHELSKGIEEINKKKPDNPFICNQCKEKLAGLRFYLNQPITDEISEMISTAFMKSIRTCELCGDVGDLKKVSDSYIQTLCDDCHKKEQARRR